MIENLRDMHDPIVRGPLNQPQVKVVILTALKAFTPATKIPHRCGFISCHMVEVILSKEKIRRIIRLEVGREPATELINFVFIRVYNLRAAMIDYRRGQ